MDDKVKNHKIRKLILIGASTAIVGIAIAFFASWALYNKTSEILDTNLRERLLSIVTTAVVEFDSHDIEQLQVEQDWHKPEWAKVVNLMKKIRENNPNILFMYMFRKTATYPTEMEFVADSHSIDPYAKIDINNDEVIDDGDQLQWPGQPYDVSDIPETFDAYNGPTTNKDIYSDQWGPVLTGYAPIKDGYGNVVAILAVDIKAGDFATITKQTLYPFLLFIAFLVLIILLLVTLLITFIVRALRKDIEQNRKIEELIKARSEFLYVASHQLRTPVSLITGTLSMLEDGDLDNIPPEQRKKMIGGLFSKAQKLTNIVNDILAASEMDIVAFNLGQGDLAPTDLRTVTKGVCDVLKEKAEQKNIKLEYENIQTGTPVTIPASARYLEHAISNIIDNAVKYTNEGFVKVELRETNNRAILTVSDSGIGIPLAEQPKMFEKFKRADNAIKTYTDGTGLGLFIVWKIIKSHPGGSVRFESAGENKGTKFIMEFSKAIK